MPDINKAYTWGIQTCNAPNIGYSQAYRNQQTVGGVTYYDCSSFINYALLAGGFSTPSYAPSHNAFTTYTMGAELLRLGFIEVDPGGEYLPGDIGVSSSHTEMCYKGGQGKGVFMGAHTSNAPLQGQVSIGSSSGNTNYERSFPHIYRYGEGGATGGYGYSLYVISAICGNWWQESGINPGIYESLKVVPLKDDSVYGGYGLGQWTNAPQYRTYRRTALANWLDDNGYSYDSGDGQLNFFIEEDIWLKKEHSDQFNNLTEFLNSTSTDLKELTYAFLAGWEGIFNNTADLRVEHANRCYEFIQSHANDSSINSWYVGNEYLSEDKKLNNAVMVYRFLSAGGGGGGTEAKKKHHMPVWMMLRNYY